PRLGPRVAGLLRQALYRPDLFIAAGLVGNLLADVIEDRPRLVAKSFMPLGQPAREISQAVVVGSAFQIDVEVAASRRRRAGNLAKLGHRRVGVRQIDGAGEVTAQLERPRLGAWFDGPDGTAAFGVLARV